MYLKPPACDTTSDIVHAVKCMPSPNVSMEGLTELSKIVQKAGSVFCQLKHFLLHTTLMNF